VELYRYCVKGIETGFKPLRQPSRFVTFSTVQKVHYYIKVIMYIIIYIIYIYSNINFHKNPSSGNRVVPCGPMDGPSDMTKLTTATILKTSVLYNFRKCNIT